MINKRQISVAITKNYAIVKLFLKLTVQMSKNKKVSSAKIAAQAAKVLNNTNASSIQKRLAGSALSQANKGSQTGAQIETEASKVLRSSKYNDTTKSLAASVLSQANKAR